MPGRAAEIGIGEKRQRILEEFRSSRAVSKSVGQRATIVPLGFAGLQDEEIVRQVGPNRQQVGVWRRRRRDAWESLCVWECREPHRLREAIREVLADAPRPGAPAKIAPEQAARIAALACEPPELSNRPITRWTHRELRDEVVEREFECARQGTTALTAGLDAVAGEIVSPTLEATRTEPEFVRHISNSSSASCNAKSCEAETPRR